jgi:hypothetical protein
MFTMERPISKLWFKNDNIVKLKAKRAIFAQSSIPATHETVK